MGSSLAEVDRAVAEWSGRLIDPGYATGFRSWLMKEHPVHEVPIHAFVAWKSPATNGDVRAWVRDTGVAPPASLAHGWPDDHPAWGFTIDDAFAFARYWADRDARPWRLPTEAEWEWMAAGPEHRRYPYGDDFDPARANTRERGLGTTAPIDAHPAGASWCGLWDLAGNVEEWTATRYAPYPGGAVVEDDLHRRGGDYPIARGGSFALGGDLARTARRHGPHPDPRNRILGCRLVSDT